jgi:hypothetical protein
MDSNFPNQLFKSNEPWNEFNCIISVVQEYSKRHLTFFDDRVVAFAGLDQRLARAMCTESRYGTFERHLQSQLLWYPLPETSNAEGARVSSLDLPTWSWMAAPGAVRFLVYRWDFYVAYNVEVQFHKTRPATLTATGVGKFIDLPRLQSELQAPSHHDIAGAGDDLCGGLWFDTEKVNTEELQCVFVVRTGKENNTNRWYYVLLVIPTENDDIYTRVGVGMIDINCVSTVSRRIQII